MDPAPERLRLLVAAGGTGGHLYPAIAVARSVMRKDPNAQVCFVGTRRGLEGRIVPEAGFELTFVRAEPLRGGGLLRKIKGMSSLLLGLWDGFRLLRQKRPHAVLGVGAYVSGPLMLAAALSGYPTLLLEPNATPGLANKWLAPFVDEAAIAWESTSKFFGDKSILTGNPVRADIATVRPYVSSNAPKRILVFGGSQGSRALNRAMTDALDGLTRAGENRGNALDIVITHQTGPNDLDWVSERYRDSGMPEARVVDYIDNMAGEYESSDIVVCRAGATSCAELSAAGRASILVPLTAAGGHQDDNARMMSDRGAAMRLPQAELDGRSLSERLVELLESPETLQRMAEAAKSLARPDAADLLADRLIALGGKLAERSVRT